MLDQLMGARYLSQGQNFRNVESLPPCLECLIDVASRFGLCVRWHIVAADEEDSGFHKHKLPDRNFRCRHIRGVSRYRTALCQHFRIGLDVRSESDLYDMMNSIGSHSPDSLHQIVARKQNLVCPRSRRDFFIAFGAARGDNSCSRLMRELDVTSSHRSRTALHQNGSPLNRTRDMNCAMSGDAGNAEASTLFERHTCG